MIEVRRAAPADAEELMTLRAVMFSAMNGRPVDTGEWRRAGAAMLRDLLAGDTMAAFVVDREDAAGLAACAVGQVDRRLPGPGDPSGLRGYVYNVATLPAYRRRGFSRACMTALLEWYARLGIGTIDLRASPEGEPLYRSLGFRHTSSPAMRLLTHS